MAKKLVMEGTGLLSGEIDWPDDPPLQRTPEEDAAATKFIFDALDRAIEKKRKQDAEAELQPALDLIDQLMTRHLGEELKAEDEATRGAPHSGDFAKFKQYCELWETPLPYLPAAPQAVAAFLISEACHGPAHVSRLLKSIAAAHRAVNLAAKCSDPTQDLFVKALLRRLKQADKPNLRKETTMPTKTGYYSDDVLDKKFSRKSLDALVKREQFPSGPLPAGDQDDQEYVEPTDRGPKRK
jgi:hypothetical protein